VTTVTDVFQTLSNLGVNYLIPKRITSSEREVIDQMRGEALDIAGESASVHVETGAHPMWPRRFVDGTVADGRSRTSINQG